MHGDYSGLCTEITVDCARRLQWIVHGDYSGLCTEVTVDCARRLQWIVHGGYSGLCTEITVDCARRLQWIVHGDYSGLRAKITVWIVSWDGIEVDHQPRWKGTISRDEKGPSAEIKVQHESELKVIVGWDKRVLLSTEFNLTNKIVNWGLQWIVSSLRSKLIVRWD